MRVLPSLVDEPVRRLPRVGDEAVGVARRARVEPGERPLDVRPDRLDEGEVRGALVVSARQRDEQRRRVDAAVVAPEGYLAERGHLALARLVENLARLGVLRGIGLGRLRLGQEREHPAGERRVDPQALERRDEPVAPEGRAVPRDAGVRVRPLGHVGRHHVDVGERAVEPLVEERVRRRRRAAARPRRGERAPGRCECGREGLCGLRAGLAGDRHVDGGARPGRHREVEAQLGTAHRARRRRRGDVRAAHDAVEAPVAEHEAVGADLGREASPVPGTHRAPHLEHVLEIGLEPQREAHAHRRPPVVRHPQPLVAAAAPEEFPAEDVERAARQHETPARVDVGVREIDGEQRVVALDGRAQQQRAGVAQAQLEARQKTRSGVVEALLALPDRVDVAVAIEHREGVAVLEDARAIVDPRGGREHVEAVTDPDDVVHGRRQAQRRASTRSMSRA